MDTSILASTLIARIFGYHFSLFDEFWFIDMARKRPSGTIFISRSSDLVSADLFWFAFISSIFGGIRR